LDDRVAQYLDGFPYPDVTVRNLLNQTSGIPDAYMSLATEHRDEFGEVLRISDVATLIQRHAPEQLWQAGEKFQYSNTNYVLLAAIIEKVSNQSMEEFMREELFKPLGMKNSRVWNRLSTAPFPHKASDFDQIGEMRTEVKPTWIDGIAGDGAVFCSLEDFLIWDEFWRGNPVISADLSAEALERARLNDGTQSDYGFGWVIEEDRVWHNGAWLGARTYIIRYLDTKGCLVVLDNSSNLRIDAITKQLEQASAPLVSKTK
jgi:CubicO group peptidase (beta-lactamase class C family)